MAGQYVLKSSGTQYVWTLHAANAEVILTSERYTSKQGAKNGIESCRANSATDSRYDRRTASDGKPYFVLRAMNDEIIGTSETYSSTSARESGIASCKSNGPTATVNDRT